MINKTPAHANYLPNKILPSKVNPPIPTSVNQLPVNHKGTTKIITSKPMPGKPQMRIVSTKTITSNASSPMPLKSPVTKTLPSPSPNLNPNQGQLRPILHRRPPQTGNIVLPKNIVGKYPY